MFILSLTRILRFSLQNFYRNIWLSIVTITIIILTLFSLTSLIVLNAAAAQAINSVKSKVDISLYFPAGTESEQVKIIQNNIKDYEEVETVKYVSATRALEIFKEEHQNDPLIQDSLAELETNPLGPTLSVKAKDTSLYPQILEKIKANKIDELTEEINYDDHKLVIQKLEDLSQKAQKFGFIISGFFALVSLLVVFNTIRIGIYTHKEEISIMKLVGAGNWFIRAPFLVEGIFYGFLSTIIFWIIFYLIIGLLQPFFYAFFIDINFNLMSYISQNFFYIFGFELIAIIMLNIISSFIAMGKYLRV